MKQTDIQHMTDDELYELALEKRTNGKMKGCATRAALMAQRELISRKGVIRSTAKANGSCKRYIPGDPYMNGEDNR